MPACTFTPMAGRDVDIDGFVWNNSPFHRHLDSDEHKTICEGTDD